MSNPLRGGHGGVLAHKAISREDSLIQVFSPCDVGTRLLEEFARARPADYPFLEPKDFNDLRSSAFGGIAEWDSFAEHVLGCTRCGEV
jgi:hypothetical protein